MSTLSDVLGRYTVADPAGLERALLDREDEMVAHLHMAATQFGLFPQIVAEVIATIGLGTQPDEETRLLIRNNFVMLMSQIQAAHSGMGEMPSPQASNDLSGDVVHPDAEPPVEVPEPEVEAEEGGEEPPDSVDRSD